MNSDRRRQRIRNLIERITGIQVYRSFGHSLYLDIKRVNPKPRVIFDVGAYKGRVAAEFSVEFPDARIYCFEPASAIYTELVRNTEKIHNVQCFRIALGGEEITQTLYLTNIPTDNSFIRPDEFISTEQAAISTIDHFLTENLIDRIDLLKIDTEGFDLEVLKGAAASLGQNKIPFVVAEVGLCSDNRKHVPFERIREFLSQFGYELFGIYNQQPEYLRRTRLRYADACFANELAVHSE